MLYTSPDALIFGFHGCDQEIGEGVLRGEVSHLRPSENKHDWLGHGIYFWENNPERALQYAKELRDSPRKRGPRIRHPFVVGAVLSFGNCLNLTEARGLQIVKAAYGHLVRISELDGLTLPKNRSDGVTGELLQRDLDCAVIEALHALRNEVDEEPYDTVRGIFQEGAELYPNAGFREKNHIQVCVRTTACIKGYFRPMQDT